MNKLLRYKKIAYLAVFLAVVISIIMLIKIKSSNKMELVTVSNISVSSYYLSPNISSDRVEKRSKDVILMSGIASEIDDDSLYMEIREPGPAPVFDSFLDSDNEYAKLAIANVTNYVNVRTAPDENSEIVGYIYNGAVANIEEIAGEYENWFKINSGNVTGYIKSDYFIYGDKAEEVASNYVTRYATVGCDRLNVRQKASKGSSRLGYIEHGEKVKVTGEDIDDTDLKWYIVEYTSGKSGYVSSEFVYITEEFEYARTLEEDKAIKEAEALLIAREQEEESKESSKKENLTKYIDTSITPADSFTSNAELRKAIVDYACQFVGGPYVSGGNSLTNGTDCSGFTMLVYQHFGYNLSRIPQGQLDGQGRKINYEDIQPGDLVFYSSKGVKATHAALYIGNGQVVHATNHRDGIKITSITWVGPVWGLKNVID